MSDAPDHPMEEDPAKRPTAGSPRSISGPGARTLDWITPRSALVVVLSGFAVVLISYGFTLVAFDTGDDVGAALAPITGVIGTIVGAFFGVQAGSEGKAEAEAARTQAEREAKALAAVAGSKGVQILRETGSLPPR